MFCLEFRAFVFGVESFGCSVSGAFGFWFLARSVSGEFGSGVWHEQRCYNVLTKKKTETASCFAGTRHMPLRPPLLFEDMPFESQFVSILAQESSCLLRVAVHLHPLSKKAHTDKGLAG